MLLSWTSFLSIIDQSLVIDLFHVSPHPYNDIHTPNSLPVPHGSGEAEVTEVILPPEKGDGILVVVVGLPKSKKVTGTDIMT